MEDMKKIPERSDIEEQYKWAIHDIYASDELWEADLLKAKELLAIYPGFAGKLGESAQALYDFLKMEEETGILADALGNYAMRRSDEDARDSKYQAMVGRLMSTYVELNAASSFATPEIMDIPDEKMEAFYAELPELERYRRLLTNMRRRRAHTLSPAEEKLLAAAGEMANAPDTIYGMFCDADITFPDCVDGEGNKHPLSQGTYISYMESPDRELRKSAFQTLYRTYGSFENTIASILSSQVKQLQFLQETL